MNNLKRVLSLALTGAMLSGLMVMGAGAADFVDAEDIQHTEAVNTVTALGIINGKPVGDGKVEFDPDAPIRRDEMAKIVAYIMNGGKEPVYSTSNYTFTDVPATQWAQKYIYYCAANQIINGDGANHFMPDQNVTASQAAKMILTVLGYNSDVFGLTGLDWESNTNSVANRPENDLYEKFYDDYGASFNPSAPATRDMVALMVYNALDAQTMTITYQVNAGNTNEGHTLTLGKPLLEVKFGAKKYEGVVTGNEYANVTATSAAKLADGKTAIALTAVDGNTSVGSYGNSGTVTVDITSGKDELGRAVTFFAREVSNKTVIVGTLAVSDSNKVYVDTKATTEATFLTDNDLTKGSPVTCGNYVKDASVTPVVGDEVIYIDNNADGTLDYIFKNQVFLAEVTDVTIDEKKDANSTLTLDSTGIGTAPSADAVSPKKSAVVGFDDVAEEDIVLATTAGGRWYVEKAPTLDGKIARYKGTTGAYTEITVDGTKYTLSKVPVPTSGVDAVATLSDITTKTNDATFYLDNNGYIIAMGNVKDTVKNYAYVVGLSQAGNNNIDGNRIRVATTDGSVKTYDLKNSLSSADDAKFGIGAVITYEIDGTTLEAKTVVTDKFATDPDSTGELQSTDGFTKGKTKVSIPGANGNSPFYATSKTIFFYVTLKKDNTTYLPDKVNVYTGYANAPSIKNGAAYKDGNTAEVNNFGSAAVTSNKADVVVFVGELADSTASDKDYLYLKDFGTTTADGKLTEANVVLPGASEVTTVDITKIVDGSNQAITKDDNAKGLYTFKIDKDGHYELTTATTNVTTNATITNVDGMNVSFNDGAVKEHALADDGVVINATATDGSIKIYAGEAKVAVGNKVTILTDGATSPTILMMVITAVQ